MATIIIEPLGGLANRMRAIAGATHLARLRGARLVIVWTLDTSLRCPWHTLLGPIQGARLIEVPMPSLRYRALHFALTHLPHAVCYDDQCINSRFKPAIAAGVDLQALFATTPDTLYIRACENITQTHDMSPFRLAPALASRARTDLKTGHTIGLHIRRTDNRQAILHSPTAAFAAAIKAELATQPDTRFYLATDSPQEEQTLCRQFPDRIIVMTKQSLDRDNPEAVRLAALDLWHLAQCERIYGSYWSSFSEVAADWGGTGLTII